MQISISAPTLIAELKDGEITEYELDPRDFGFEFADIKTLYASNASESKTIIEGILNGTSLGPCRDIVLLNAGAAIYAANLAVTLEDGINAAHEVIASGAAKAKLDALIAFTQKLATH